jgi:hypothetical protein
MEEVEAGEFIDTLAGMLAMGYLLSTKVSIRTLEDVERASFRVNPSYVHDLKDALDPIRRRRRKNSGGGAAVEVSKRLLRLWPWLSAIISGLLGAAALPPFNQTWLIWIALCLCARRFYCR